MHTVRRSRMFEHATQKSLVVQIHTDSSSRKERVTFRFDWTRRVFSHSSRSPTSNPVDPPTNWWSNCFCTNLAAC